MGQKCYMFHNCVAYPTQISLISAHQTGWQRGMVLQSQVFCHDVKIPRRETGLFGGSIPVETIFPRS